MNMAKNLHNSLWEAAGATGSSEAANENVAKSNGMHAVPQETSEERGAAVEDSGKGAAEASLVRKLLDTKVRSFNTALLEGSEQQKLLASSGATWQELHVPAPIIRGLQINLGFDRPSPIQCVALDILLKKGRNLIAQSQSGTGKTMAFVIGMLFKVDPSQHYPQALVVEPTFELAQQTADVIRRVINNVMDVEVIEAVKGSKLERGVQIRQHIIVGTPGTVMDWITKSKVFDPKKIKIFVLDEADVMIAEQGLGDNSVRIYNTMDKQKIQTAFFSATYEPKIMELARKIVQDPEVIAVKQEDLSLDTIHQYYIVAETEEAKVQALRNLYGIVTVDNAMVFCRTRESTRRLYQTMKADGHSIGVLEGQMDVKERAESIARFRDGLERILIATNVASRGIDVQAVNLVVNFDLPMKETEQGSKRWVPDFETYLHRIGRTGRFGRAGLAINFVSNDRDMETIHQFEKYFKREIHRLNAEDIDELERLNQETSGE
ncbi:hypothetical protein RvY_17826 [Ramazzottius varieornatus]|uniref:RNA helicase n=1 Tax=Ramazzottius varieornatus TaxID=947166 RepID=A0A1D1W3R2_RAMVA|nr:hypothetical protein RvY_17826 [Ramazzottius varieornatus]